MFDPSEILALFEAQRAKLGLSQAEVGRRAFGKAVNTAFQDLKKGSSPAIDRVAAIARVLDLDLHLGPKQQNALDMRSMSPATISAHPANEPHDLIPLHDAFLAAGAGAYNGTELAIEHLSFPRVWLRELGVRSSNGALAKVSGESMQPTLWPGDVVLIDLQVKADRWREDPKRPRRWPIFAFLDQGEARVKRLGMIDATTLLITSDNPEYPPEIRRGSELKDLRVIGKVVWWGHTVRD